MSLPVDGGVSIGPTGGVQGAVGAITSLPPLPPLTDPNAGDPAAALQAAIAQAMSTAGTSGKNPYAWMDPIFAHYVGHYPSQAEINQVVSNRWNEDDLIDHLRSQPSYIKGLTIGALEDYHKSADPAMFKWLGRYASDSDIRELVNAGVKTGDDIEKYITNRPDVVAAHPGAPLGLNDTQWGQHKAAIDSDYQANLGRASTNQEARDAYAQAASPFRRQPAEQVGLSAGVGEKSSGINTGALISSAQVAPNARLGMTG